jgi:hypothetical protein
MRRVIMRNLLLSLVTLFSVACAAPTGDAADSNEDDLTKTGGIGPASKRLSSELFSDADPGKNDPIEYVLVGKSGKDQCLVTVHRSGLAPAKNTWSTVEITPLTKDGQTTDIGWAMTKDASSTLESISVKGDELVYKRLPHGQEKENMTLTAHFASGEKHGWATLTDAEIDGTNVVGKQKASCEGLSELIVLQWSKVEPIAKKAFDGWMKDNDDDTEMDFEGCNVASPTTVACGFGNDTNEEQLGLTFAIENGKLGKLLDAERSSDFN